MLSKILNRLLFERDIRPTELAREINIPQPTIHRIVKGKCSNPHESSLIPIANYFNISVDQLKGKQPLPFKFAETDLPENKDTNTIKIPFIRWSEADKRQSPLDSNSDFIIGTAKLNPHSFALTMDDSSMEPLFGKGSTLIFDPDKIDPIDRNYILVKLDGDGKPIFRQLLVDANHQYLKPLNPDLTAFNMRVLAEKDKIIATLVEARRNYDNPL